MHVTSAPGMCWRSTAYYTSMVDVQVNRTRLYLNKMFVSINNPLNTCIYGYHAHTSNQVTVFILFVVIQEEILAFKLQVSLF